MGEYRQCPSCGNQKRDEKIFRCYGCQTIFCKSCGDAATIPQSRGFSFALTVMGARGCPNPECNETNAPQALGHIT